MEEEKNKEKFDEEEFEERIEGWFKSKFGEGKARKRRTIYKTGAAGGVYCLGLIGALVYYIGTSTSFWDGVLGILKSLVWPAFMVHGLMSFLGL
jgi:hypothetical protein